MGLPRGLVVHLRHADRSDPAEFARTLGCPVRFGRAANALVSVKAAATSAGFADTPGCSRAFTRRMGCSPSQYRAGLAS